MKEQMREAFEAWWGQTPIELEPLKPRSIDENVSVWAWQAWQAALSAVPAQPAISDEQIIEVVSLPVFRDGIDTRHEDVKQSLIDSIRSILQAQQPAQEPVKQESWISVEERLPEVKHEDYEFVLVAVDSAHTGKTHVFEAAYLNQVEVMTEDGNYISFTGWHTRTEHPDYDGWYESIGKNGDDRVVTHWMVKPLPPVSRSDEQPVKEVTE